MSAEMEARAAPPRLREETGALGQALEMTAQATAMARPLARTRVWQQLARSPNRLRINIWRINFMAGAGALALAAVIAIVFWSAHTRPQPWQLEESSGSVRLESAQNAAPLRAGARLPAHARLVVGAESAAVITQGGVRLALAPGSRIQLDDLPILEEGSAAVRVLEAHRFRIAAGSYTLDSAGGLFFAEVSAQRTRVRAEGAPLHVKGTSGEAEVAADSSWSTDAKDFSGANEDPALRPLGELVRATKQTSSEPLREVALYRAAPGAIVDEGGQLLVHAHDAESAKQYVEAASLYAQLAKLDGPRAPAALYELARVRLRFLAQPAAALEALGEARTRFPNSALSQEVSLSAIEARLALGHDDATVQEMNRFLDQFSSSERASEVRWLRASLEVRAGNCALAARDLDALQNDSTYGGDALLGQASCARRAGDEANARAHLRDYLRRFPSGPNRRDAEAALAGAPLAFP